MNEFLLDMLAKTAPTAISALLATWVAVRFALDRYKKEALWMRKLDAYTRILDALHVCRLNAENTLDEYTGGEGVRSKEYKEKMRLKVNDAYSELQKVIDTGSLIISDAATRYLKEKMLPRINDWQNDPPDEFWAREEKLMDEALAQITSLARKELKNS
jgi:hypothetical protein